MRTRESRASVHEDQLDLQDERKSIEHNQRKNLRSKDIPPRKSAPGGTLSVAYSVYSTRSIMAYAKIMTTKADPTIRKKPAVLSFSCLSSSFFFLDIPSPLLFIPYNKFEHLLVCTLVAFAPLLRATTWPLLHTSTIKRNYSFLCNARFSCAISRSTSFKS